MINNPSEIGIYRAFGGFTVDNRQEGDVVLNPIYVLSLIGKLKWQNIRWKNTQGKNQKQEEKRMATIGQLNDILSQSIGQVKGILP